LASVSALLIRNIGYGTKRYDFLITFSNLRNLRAPFIGLSLLKAALAAPVPQPIKLHFFLAEGNLEGLELRV
jgi:hypothetical protein